MPDFHSAISTRVANDDQINITADVVRALTRIVVKVRNDIGEDAAREALDVGLGMIDNDDPSTSDLADLAERVGADLGDLLDDGGSDEAAASANGSVSLTANTRSVASAHGLPSDWHALDGIDLPPSLADATLDDRGLAAAINRANGWDRDAGEGVTPHRVGNLRDKGGAGRPGASVEDLAGNDAGLNSDLDEEPPLPASTVRQRVSRHLSKTGRDGGLNSGDGFGASLDDL